MKHSAPMLSVASSPRNWLPLTSLLASASRQSVDWVKCNPYSNEVMTCCLWPTLLSHLCNVVDSTGRLGRRSASGNSTTVSGNLPASKARDIGTALYCTVSFLAHPHSECAEIALFLTQHPRRRSMIAKTLLFHKWSSGPRRGLRISSHFPVCWFEGVRLLHIDATLVVVSSGAKNCCCHAIESP
jgi:hypothetical protein